MSEEEITRLYRIRKNVMKMLRDRGYVVGDFEIEMSKSEFIQKYGDNMKREDLVIIKGLRSNTTQQVSLSLSLNVRTHIFMGYKRRECDQWLWT